ncbi:MAG: hypothetical protein KDD61_04370 [Bdellovibrionales bacterium]|nr:hypothetical protein [Bdellovibrionales bacterium]
MRFLNSFTTLTLSILFLAACNNSSNDGPGGGGFVNPDDFKPPVNKLNAQEKQEALLVFSEFGKSAALRDVVENWNRRRDPNVGGQLDPNLKSRLEQNCQFQEQRDEIGAISTYITGADCPIEATNEVKSQPAQINGPNVTIIMDMKNSFIAKSDDVNKATALQQTSIAGQSMITGNQNEGNMNVAALLQGTTSFIPFPNGKSIVSAPTYMAMKTSQTRTSASSEIRLGMEAGQWYEIKIIEQSNFETGTRTSTTYLNGDVLSNGDTGKLPTLSILNIR